MSSRVDVINRALQHHAGKRVVTEDQTPLSQNANAMYDVIRDKELTNNLWAFSIVRVSLSASTTAPDWGYDNFFPLQEDHLRLVEVENYPPYKIETGGILTDCSAPLKISYVQRVEDPGKFPAIFSEVLAASIAYNMTEIAKSSADDKQRMLAAYNQFLSEAVRTNAIQLPPVENVEDDWITVRN